MTYIYQYTLRYTRPGQPGVFTKRTRQDTMDQAIASLPRDAQLLRITRITPTRKTP